MNIFYSTAFTYEYALCVWLALLVLYYFGIQALLLRKQILLKTSLRKKIAFWNSVCAFTLTLFFQDYMPASKSWANKQNTINFFKIQNV